MTESLFSAFGKSSAEVEADPFKIPDNTYDVSISGAEKKEFKDVPYFVIEFTVVGGEHAGKNVSQMLRLIPWTQADRPNDYQAMNARTISSLKKWLIDCGIDESQLDAFNPAIHGRALLGIKGKADIGPNNKGYNQISNFVRSAVAAPANAPTNAEPAQAVDQDELARLMGNLG
jgi:hypothetical protein